MTGVSALTNSYSFSTCPNSSSTGVARPKIDTATFTRERPSSTSSTTPLNDANGPSDKRQHISHAHSRERGERSVGHAHLLADLERHRRLRTLNAFLHLMQDTVGFSVRNRHRLFVGAAKSGDLRRVLDEVIDLVGEIHLHQHVAGEELALGLDLAAAARLGDFFLRHQYLADMLGEPALLGLLADRIRDLVLEIRIGVYDVPALRLGRRRCLSGVVHR